MSQVDVIILGMDTRPEVTEGKTFSSTIWPQVSLSIFSDTHEEVAGHHLADIRESEVKFSP